MTTRKEKTELITQGGSWGPLECSTQIDNLGKECLNQDKGLYKFKESVNICPLAMIDDVAGIERCGADSVELNTIINSKIKSKWLEFGEDKCVFLHIGKRNHSCSVLKAQSTEMKNKTEAKYLGNIFSEDGSCNKNIEERYNKGIGIICSINSLLKNISLRKHYFKIGLLFRETNVINGIMSCIEVMHNLNNEQIKK